MTLSFTKKKVIAICSSILLIICLISNHAYATSDYNKSIEIYVDSHDDYQKQVSDLMSDGYTDVNVVFTDLNKEDPVASNPPQLKSLGPIKRYYVKNVRKGSDYIGKSRIASASGAPGVRLSIKTKKDVSTTISATFGASYTAISAAVGWNVTKTERISVTGSAKVPYKVGKKKVKRGVLSAYPMYKTKKYDVYYGIQNTKKDRKKGTGVTMKPIGTHFKMSYTYK